MNEAHIRDLPRQEWRLKPGQAFHVRESIIGDLRPAEPEVDQIGEIPDVLPSRSP